jgi:Protein of unknown function (DUF3460)
MPFFARAHYTSDVTQFIDSLKAAHPGLEAAQRQGRNQLWDKQIDREQQQDMRVGQVAQQPYPYQTAPSQR